MKTFVALFSSRTFVLVNLANFLEGICYFGMVPLLIPFVQRYFALNDVQAGWILLYYTGLVTLLMFPGGFLCDRLGPGRSLILALLLGGLGRLGLVTSLESMNLAGKGVIQAITALTVMAAGTGIFQPSVYAAVKEYTSKEQAPPGFSWLYSIMNLGSLLWFLISPSVRSWGDIVGVYQVLTVVTWCNLLCFSLLFRSPPQTVYLHERREFTERCLWNPRFLVFIWLLVPVRSLVAHLSYTLPTAIIRTYPWLADRLEYCFSLNHFLLFVATPLLTYLTLRSNLMTLMIIGALLSSGALSFLMLPAQTIWLIAFIVFFSLGEAIWQSRFFEYVAHQAPPSHVGAAMSLANFPWFVAKTTVGSYSGWMLMNFIPERGAQDPQFLWGSYLLLSLLTPVSLWVLRKWLMQGLSGFKTNLADCESRNS